MLLAPAALLGVRGEVWVDPDAASRCPMLTYRWIHQPGLLDLQLHSDTSVMARWSTVPGTLHSELHMRGCCSRVEARGRWRRSPWA